MKKILLVIVATLLLCFNAVAFDPKDLDNATIKQIAPCQESICVLLEKNGHEYVVVGLLDPAENFYPTSIYLVEGKKLKQVWGAKWLET